MKPDHTRSSAEYSAHPEPCSGALGRPMPTLLVVDDEPELRSLLTEYLTRFGFIVRVAADASQARALVAQDVPRAVVLDLNMPGENGLSFAVWLRQTHPGTAIVMLTAQNDLVDRAVGLELAADDYIGKPFELRELLARLRAVLRRTEAWQPAAVDSAQPPAGANAPVSTLVNAVSQAVPPVVVHGQDGALAGPGRLLLGEHVLDLEQRKLLGTDGIEVEITAAEFDLLWLFARHPNRPLSREQIMEQAHKRSRDIYDRSIDLRVMRLRRKIERNADKPELLKTVRGVGYVYVPAAALCEG